MSKHQRKVTDFTKLTDKALKELYDTGFLFLGKTLEEVIELYIMANNTENYTLEISKLQQLPNYLKEPLLDKEREIIEAIQQLKKAIYEPLSEKDKKTYEKRSNETDSPIF